LDNDGIVEQGIKMKKYRIEFENGLIETVYSKEKLQDLKIRREGVRSICQL
jgi:hypothetical protein